MHNQLIILRGNSGSGKTTVAQHLQAHFGSNTMLISCDMIRMKILHVKGQEGIRRTQPLMIELLRYGAANSCVTVMEGVLPSDAYADLFEAALAIYGAANIHAYYYDIPFAETLARHETKPNHADFGEAAMRSWWRDKDYLSNIRETTFDASVTLEDAVARIARDVENTKEDDFMYTKLTITPLWHLKGGQDGTIYGDYIFRFDHKGHCTVHSLSTCNYVGEFDLDKLDCFVPHSNAVAFGAEKFDESDEFPLLYTNLYNTYSGSEDRREGVVCVYRITREEKTFTGTLVQVIRIGFVEDRALWKSCDADVRPYGNFVVDAAAKKLYAFVMRDADKVTRYFGFELPKLADGVSCETCGAKVVTLTPDDITIRFDGKYSNYVQGACCKDGIIYSVEGFNGDLNDHNSPNRPRIQIMDAVKGEQIGDFDLCDLGLMIEPEFIEWAGDRLIYSDAHGNYFRFELA